MPIFCRLSAQNSIMQVKVDLDGLEMSNNSIGICTRSQLTTVADA